VRPNPVNLGTASGLGAIVLWSTTFAFARSLSEQVGPLTAGGAAYLLGGCFCLVRLASPSNGFAQVLKLPQPYLFGCGSLFVFYPVAIYLAVGLAKDRDQLLQVALVNYLWPALTVLLSLLLLNKRANLWLAPGTLLALVGVVLVMTQGDQISWALFLQNLRGNPAPYGLALAGAIAWGLYSNLARRWSDPGGAGAAELFIPAAGLALLGLRLLATEPTGWNLRAIADALVLSVATCLAYVLWDIAMRRGNLLLVAVCSYLTPLLSTIVSCVYLHVSPGPRLWTGCLLLVCGSFISWRAVADEPAPPSDGGQPPGGPDGLPRRE
jgi:drug/metabolite transporter (DMT)-like permease